MSRPPLPAAPHFEILEFHLLTCNHHVLGELCVGVCVVVEGRSLARMQLLEGGLSSAQDDQASEDKPNAEEVARERQPGLPITLSHHHEACCSRQVVHVRPLHSDPASGWAGAQLT